jgi:hypothetical protein
MDRKTENVIRAVIFDSADYQDNEIIDCKIACYKEFDFFLLNH